MPSRTSKKSPRAQAATKRGRTSAHRGKGEGSRGKKTKIPATNAGGIAVTEMAELEDLRRELERVGGGASPMRWNADPDDVQRSVARLVLTLVEFIRRLLERQAIRRMEGGTLNDVETEDIGQALMKLEETVRDIAAKFGIVPDDLNLDLGPVGKLM